MNMDIIYKKLCKKIEDKEILDSEIIWDVECAKRKDPGFDINWVDDYGNNRTLLRYAVVYGREELVRHFLTYSDLNVNYRDWDSYTALHFARGPILKLLLSRQDLDVNMQNKHGWTVLHRECWYNHVEYARELLLDARVNIMIRSRRGNTARDYVIPERYIGIANMLKMVQYTPLLRIPNGSLCNDIIRMIIEEYV